LQKDIIISTERCIFRRMQYWQCWNNARSHSFF